MHVFCLGYLNCACTEQLGTKMEVSKVCAPQFAVSDAKTNISSSLSAASVTGSETVINSKTDSTLVKGEFCLECKHSAGLCPYCPSQH